VTTTQPATRTTTTATTTRPTTTAISSTPEVLARSRDAIDPAIRTAVATLGPELRLPVAYHLGWTDAEGRPTAGGGKGVRGALALLSAEAAGADAEVGVPGAVAIELVHNFSLLHDDIIDGDRERRHRPTVWALFGVGRAIIVGDALLTLAMQVLHGSDAARAAAAELIGGTALMIEGQADDMAFESRLDVTVSECLRMEGYKTGALLSCASCIGAILAGAPEPVVGALRDYGFQLGLAFQAVDDLLGIWGSPERTGKPRWSDLDGGKKSLPITVALAADHPAGAELRALLANGGLDDAARTRAASLIEDTGARGHTEDVARTCLDRALVTLDAADLDPAAADELRGLARFVVEREF
jgi:geranylgeranyl diphosphate synthase, type I